GRFSPPRHLSPAIFATYVHFPISLVVVVHVLSACCCPLAPAHRPASGLTINICGCCGRGRGSPGRSEAERRGPPSSMPVAEPNFGSERAAGWSSRGVALETNGLPATLRTTLARP